MTMQLEDKPLLDASMLHFLLDPAKSSGFDMLRLGILQQALQQQLHYSRKKSPIPGSKKGFTVLYHVERGAKYTYPCERPLSAPFLKPFSKKAVVYPLPFYAHRLILDVEDDYDKYKKKHVGRQLIDMGLALQKGLLGNKFELTEKGRSIQTYLTSELTQANELFDSWSENNLEEFISFIDRTGFLFLMVENLNFHTLGSKRTELIEASLSYAQKPALEHTDSPLPPSHFEFSNIFGALTSEKFSFSTFQDPFTGNLELGFETELDEMEVFQSLKKRQ